MSIHRIVFMMSMVLSGGAFASVCVDRVVEPPFAILEQTQKINLNTADVATLVHSFRGIGQKRAEAIVAYREAHPFKTIAELAGIRGLGVGFVKQNLEQLEMIYSVD